MPFAQSLFSLSMLALYFVAKWMDGRLYRILTQEDNFGEFVQFVILLYAIQLLWRAREFAGKFKPLVYVGQLCLFFLAGEEISWGQRFFGFSWPLLQSANTQNELNLHNILPLHANLVPYYLASAVLALVIPALCFGFSKYLRLNFGKLDFVDSVLAVIPFVLCYLFLSMSHHTYFYEFSEVWIYGLLVLQIRAMTRDLVTPPKFAPYLFAAMAMSLWMSTSLYSTGF